MSKAARPSPASRMLTSIWTESVFHVLAHVDAGALASSCFDRAYVAWARERLGPIEARDLGEGVAIIARAATTHDVLARAQALAWVFSSTEQIARVEDRDLASLDARDVERADALAIATSAGPITEVLRASAELELPLLASLEAPAIDERSIARALAEAARAAPALAGCDVALARPLGLRGRVLGRSIVVGVPGIACPDAEHVAWQAAHEATVGSVIDRAFEDVERSAIDRGRSFEDVERSAVDRGRSFEDVERTAIDRGRSFEDAERTAIALLRSRARSAGLGDAHGRWLARLDLRALGSIPDIDDPAE